MEDRVQEGGGQEAEVEGHTVEEGDDQEEAGYNTLVLVDSERKGAEEEVRDVGDQIQIQYQEKVYEKLAY